jgi:hypothetical protein
MTVMTVMMLVGYCQFSKGCNIRIRVRFYVLDRKNAFNPGSNPST